MERRGFLGAMLAACVAPALVKAESLMQLSAPARYVMSGGVLVPAAYVGMMISLSGYPIISDRNGLNVIENVGWSINKVPLVPNVEFPTHAHPPMLISSFTVWDKEGRFVSRGALNQSLVPGDTLRLRIEPEDWM